MPVEEGNENRAPSPPLQPMPGSCVNLLRVSASPLRWQKERLTRLQRVGADPEPWTEMGSDSQAERTVRAVSLWAPGPLTPSQSRVSPVTRQALCRVS